MVTRKDKIAWRNIWIRPFAVDYLPKLKEQKQDTKNQNKSSLHYPAVTIEKQKIFQVSSQLTLLNDFTSSRG